MPRVKSWKDSNYIKHNVVCFAVMKDMELPEVARRINIEKGTLYRNLNNPKNIRIGVLEKLAKLFDCRIEDLIYPNERELKRR